MDTVLSTIITNIKFVQIKFNHSKTRSISKNNYVSSPVFTVAGLEWRILYYPRGRQGEDVALCLELFSRVGRAVKLSFEIQLLDKNGATSAARNRKIEFSFRYKSTCSGCSSSVNSADIEANCVANDYLVLNCYFDIPFSAERNVSKNCSVVAPPSNLAEHFEKLLDSDEETDVTFIVDGEEIHAHRLVLAARSPVFKAQLLGKMAETSMRHVTIQDMNASIFKVLLKFIYTDLLSEDREFIIGANAGSVTDSSINMYQHLLSAADRFGLGRLKLICEDKLCKSMSVHMVGTTLALAEQHNCHKLKASCLEFLTTTENLKAVVPTDGFVHLIQSCPSILHDLGEKLGENSDLLAMIIMFEKLARRIQDV